MCFQVECSSCRRPSWAGCGNHIDGCLRDVKMEERCACKARTTAEHRSAKSTGSSGSGGGFSLASLFGMSSK